MSDANVTVLREGSIEYLAYRFTNCQVVPSGSTGYFAFLPVDANGQSNAPSSGDWITASWHLYADIDCDTDEEEQNWYLRLLVGPGQTFHPDAGLYRVEIKIDAGTEVVFLPQVRLLLIE